MKKRFCIVIMVAIISSCTNNNKISSAASEKTGDNLTLRGETNDLPAPESVYYDKSENLLYISLQAGAEPGDGTIGKMTLDGKIITTKFAEGLNDPKWMTIVNGKLYAGDLKELVEIDLATGRILNRFTGEKITFLNDVTSEVKGNVYVSDMFTSSIYRLDANKNFTESYSSPVMENPNGLLVVGNEMYLAGWGNFTDGQPITAPEGRFQKINMATKKITRITKEVLGNLDGIQVKDQNSFFVSDWKLGKLFTITKDGVAKELLNLGRGMGDILFIPELKLLALPMKLDNKVVFYTVN